MMRPFAVGVCCLVVFSSLVLTGQAAATGFEEGAFPERTFFVARNPGNGPRADAYTTTVQPLISGSWFVTLEVVASTAIVVEVFRDDGGIPVLESFSRLRTASASSPPVDLAEAMTYRVVFTPFGRHGVSVLTEHFVPRPNMPPVALLSVSPTRALTFDAIAADGSASYDPDGTIVASLLDWGDGSLDPGPVAVHGYQDNGLYTVALTVWDDRGAPGTATVQIEIDNRPPVAAFRFDPTTPFVGELVHFDASASYDLDGGIVECSWDSGIGPLIVGPCEFYQAFPNAGSYLVTLTVTDDDGAQSTLSQIVTVLPGPAPPRRAAYLDQVVFSVEPSESTALARVSDGQTMQLYTRPLTGLSARQAAFADPNVRTVETFGFVNDLFVNPVPHAEGVPGFNPFQIPEVRRALSSLVDRDHIVQQIEAGFAVPYISPFHPKDAEYARQAAFFRELDRQYSHRPDLARVVIFQALQTVPGMTFAADGRWYYLGAPLTIRLVIRVEDLRLPIGDYVAGLLEGLGMTVIRDYRPAASAFETVYFGPPDIGAWHVYTEAFAFTSPTAWQDSFLADFYTDISGESIWELYDAPPELQAVAFALSNEQYRSYEERLELIRRGSQLALEDGIRIWLVAENRPIISNRAVTGFAHDFLSGLHNLFALRTARYGTTGGTLLVGQPLPLLSARNPVRGYSVLPDRIERDVFIDPGVEVHPHTGRYVSVRATPSVVKAGPDGGLDVPSDALVWDVLERGFEAVGPGARAMSKVTLDFDFGTWHHGIAATMDDVWNLISHFYRRQSGDVIDPFTGRPFPPGDLSVDYNADSPEVRTFLSLFKGARQLDEVTLEIYLDYWHLDPGAVAAIADVFPLVPWELQELMAKTVLDGETAYSSQAAITLGRPVLDLTTGSSISFLASDLSTLRVESFVPPGFQSLIQPSEAAARWAALDAFFAGRAHFFVSNGPFVLDSVDLNTRMASFERFTEYPFAADHWDFLFVPRIPVVSLQAVPDIVPGTAATIGVEATLNGAPYFDVVIDFLVFDPATDAAVLRGKSVRTDTGWRIELTAEETSRLSPGTYDLEVIAVGAEAAIPVLANASLRVVSGTASGEMLRGGGPDGGRDEDGRTEALTGPAHALTAVIYTYLPDLGWRRAVPKASSTRLSGAPT